MPPQLTNQINSIPEISEGENSIENTTSQYDLERDSNGSLEEAEVQAEAKVDVANSGQAHTSEEQSANPFVVPPSIAQNLPNEILVSIFSYLSPGCLDAASLVCHNWLEAASDASWRGSFLHHFSSSKFNRVTSSLKWRTELMTRLDYLHKWKKGHCNNLSFNGLIWDISHVFCDFEASRIIAFSIWRGVGTIADPTRGKVANQRVFTNKMLQTTADTSAVDGSRFGLIYGFLGNGKVQATLFSHETRLRDYLVMKGPTHFGDVTAVWINKLESPRTTSKIGALSGGEDGHIFQWELNGCTLVKDFAVCPEYVKETAGDEKDTKENPVIVKARRIIHIQCDSKDKIVCINNYGEVFASFSGNDFIKIGEFIHPIVQDNSPTISYFDVDFTSNYVIYAHGQYFMRFKLTQDENKFESVHFSLPGITMSHNHIVAASMDHTTFPVSDLSTDTPGFNFRYLAAATSNNMVYVWLLQDDLNEKNVIVPLRRSESPFQLSEESHINGLPNIPNSRPSITAIALNSMVLLLGSYNGVTVSLDLLTGEFLRVVSARFSKRALNLRATEDPDSVSLWPITQLEIDPDPSNPHGIIVVRSAIQYFDLGVDAKKSSIKKKGVHKKRTRIPYDYSQPSRSTRMTEEIEMDLELMDFEDEELHEVRKSKQNQGYIEGLSEEDQMKYALMLSEEAAKESELKTEEEEDEDVRRAINLSMAESSSEPGPSRLPAIELNDHSLNDHSLNDHSLNDHSDDSSMYRNPNYMSNPIAPPPSYDEDMDEELRLAIELSKADSAYNSDSQLYDHSEDSELEMAIKLSLEANK